MKRNEMANNNNNGFDFADSNGRPRRDRDIQAKRNNGFKCASDKHHRECSWSNLPSGDKERDL